MLYCTHTPQIAGLHDKGRFQPMKATRSDIALSAYLPACTTSPEQIPVTYTIGGKTYRGFPAEFSPKVTRRRIDSAISEAIYTAKTPEGLTLRAECIEYRDYAVTDWVMYITNDSAENSPIISDWHFDLALPAENPTLYHGNGDTCTPDGYEWWTTPVTAEGIVKQPCGDGTPCNGAFPYMRLFTHKGHGFNIAVGWSGTWRLEAKLQSAGDFDETRVTVGQAAFRSYLKPGETVRTPRLTMQAFTDGDDRGRNLWRSFYIDHILPREDGHPLDPKLVLHTWMIDGLPEFCGVTEENQLAAIDTYLAGGLKPDIWWIDAGWYPCNNDWPMTGNWYPNPDHFPRGMGPVGEKLQKEGIDFLVWFEPERVRRGSDLWNRHPEWLLHYLRDDNPWLADNALFDLGNPAACDWLIDTIDRIIKDSLRGRLNERKLSHYTKILPEVALQSSKMERRADEAERETVKMKKAEYMTYHIGEEYEGIISSVTSFGIFVELENTVEGIIRYKDIDEFFDFDEENYTASGRENGRIFRIGDTLNVRVFDAIPELKEIVFEIV